jgi:hypothetical protein
MNNKIILLVLMQICGIIFMYSEWEELCKKPIRFIYGLLPTILLINLWLLGDL